MNQREPIPEIISRLEKRKREVWNGIELNPYYVIGQHPTEYQDLVIKIKELKSKTK